MDNRNGMADTMSDSECSDSSESQSSSAASMTSSESDQSSQSLEPARILKQDFDLPKGLCENPNIFHEFFSLDTWYGLPPTMKEHLKTFLPQFNGSNDDPLDEQREAELTIQKLFTNQLNRFDSSPLIDLQKNLEEGNCRPDISRFRANLRKSQRREQRFQQCERVSRLAKSLLVSREKMLRGAYNSPAGADPRIDKMFKQLPKLSPSAAAFRARKRYFQEITNVAEATGLETPFSEEELSPDGLPTQLTRKQRRQFNNIHVSDLETPFVFPSN